MARPHAILEVAARAGRETYACFVPRNEAMGQRIYDLLHALGAEGHYDPAIAYVVVGRDGVNTNVMLVLPAGQDYEPLLRLIVTESALRLAFLIGRLDVPQEYDQFVAYARLARAQDN